MTPTNPVRSLPFVGPRHEALLKKLGIATVRDLLYHVPSRYEHYELQLPITSIQGGETLTAQGTINSFRHIVTRRRGFTIQEATLRDKTGEINLTWFNQPFLRTMLKQGMNISVAGTAERDGNRLIIKNPEYEIPRGILIHTGRIVPVYPETGGISSKWLRSKIAMLLDMGVYGNKFSVLSSVSEWVPQNLLGQHRLIGLHEALRSIHFPNRTEEADKARHRLAMDELVTLRLAAIEREAQWKERRRGIKIAGQTNEVQRFIRSLPFSLTTDQERVIDEILADISQSIPMNRLLQGDVGSGKTVVAAAAAAATIAAGFQVAFMAPTQVLADQHGETLTSLLESFKVSITILTGGTAKRTTRGKKKPNLIIGTHALIYDRAKDLIDSDRLALVIIDEQHRFGVSQRAELSLHGKTPHVLSMTATPIPRTIALTFFSDLSMSVLTEKPIGRLPVKTWVVPEEKRGSSYLWMKKEMTAGAQVFVVCPFIDQSEKETVKTVKATTAEFERLRIIFSEFRVRLMHGKMPAKEKTSILSAMRAGNIDLLVTTPVVEVGVDIPSAAIIVIEGAERFGLAQLHQLRGRVGRRDKQAYCLLFVTKNEDVSRIKIMETTSSGMMLAQADLRRRGPGDLWGTAQHGWPTLRIADITDIRAVHEAYRIAQELSAQTTLQPAIQARISPYLAKKVVLN